MIEGNPNEEETQMGDRKRQETTEIGQYRAGGYGGLQTEATAAADKAFEHLSAKDKKRARDLISNYHAPGVNPEALNHTYKGAFAETATDCVHGTRPNELPVPQAKDAQRKQR
jgi:hypothetical protein